MSSPELEQLTKEYKGELRQLLPEQCADCYQALSACSSVAGRLALKGVEPMFVKETFAANFKKCLGVDIKTVHLGCDTVDKKICTNEGFNGQSPSQAEETVWQNLGLVYVKSRL